MSSLPAPVSPVMSTGNPRSAARAMAARRCQMRSPSPTMRIASASP